MKKPPVTQNTGRVDRLDVPVYSSGSRLIAEGLFTWQGIGFWPLPILAYKTFTIDEVKWRVASRESGRLEPPTYQVVSERAEQIDVICPEYRQPWAMVSFGKEPWMIERPGAEAILRDPVGLEFARARTTWKDEDNLAGIKYRISFRADAPPVLVALTLGLLIGSFGTLHYY